MPNLKIKQLGLRISLFCTKPMHKNKMKLLSILLKRAGKESKELEFGVSFSKNNRDRIFANDTSNSKSWNECSNNGQELLAGRVNGKVFLPDLSLKPEMIYKEEGGRHLKLSQYGKIFSDMNLLNSPKNPLEIELFPRGKKRFWGHFS